ncbi:poly-gamma-glutamate hydrolase family protein [Streptomyces sp. cg2]|uniref:poly-gamma-glutamate hydrolase family protein n=1 Tax=Streptomyces sp. cg2 TaxID=3238799 RepID=UPI0034E2EAC1
MPTAELTMSRQRHRTSCPTRPAKATTIGRAVGVAALLLALDAPLATAASSDTYRNYADLAAHETEGVDYLRTVHRGTTGVAHIAIHGGKIEAGTTELARESAAGKNDSFYSFQGIKPTGNSALHITATHFDEPKALQLVKASRHTVSWHGMAGDAPATYVGGKDKQLRDRIRTQLRAAGFNAPDKLPPKLEGVDPANITNRNGRGMGVQLEITRAQRDALMTNGKPNAAFRAYTAAVEKSLP